MKTYLHEKTFKYDGTQLKSHFAYDSFDIQGDSIVAFLGECNVKLSAMVDLEDVKAKDSIYSENMVHFIVEFFDLNLEKTICFYQQISNKQK